MLKIKSKKINNELEIFKKDLEKIEVYEMKAENDIEHSAKLKGSYELLEYDVENYEVDEDLLKLYTINEDKVIFRGKLDFPKNLVDEKMLYNSFSRLIEYIQKINEKIEFYKNYYETIEKNK